MALRRLERVPALNAALTFNFSTKRNRYLAEGFEVK
jgi:hypothetical protein